MSPSSGQSWRRRSSSSAASTVTRLETRTPLPPRPLGEEPVGVSATWPREIPRPVDVPRRRNLFLGGGSEGGRSPPPSCLARTAQKGASSLQIHEVARDS